MCPRWAEWFAGTVADRVSGGDVQEAVQSLPRVHLLVLRAALAGFGEAELAALVGVPRESVWPLMQVAVAKLGSALR
jgi:DNA-directed RNA polymerase specialized sigma24 family protein